MSQYFYAEDETTTIEASSVFTPKLQVVIPNVPVGRYEWEWCAEVNISSANRQVQVQFLEDGVIANEQEIEPSNASNWYSVSGFKRYDQAVAGPVVLELLFRRSANPGTASMRRARIKLKSV